MTRVKLRPYATSAIDIRIALAQNANGSAIASSNRANITDSNGQIIEQLLPEQAFQAVASNSKYPILRIGGHHCQYEPSLTSPPNYIVE